VLIAYLGTRGLLIAVALVNGALRHHALQGELAHWDGLWYLRLARDGYPTYVPHAANVRTTLGFFPLYPIAIWLLFHAVAVNADAGGLIIAATGGLVATLLVERLASGWWGQADGRRAAILFCLLPGSVVFSMDYSEGLLIALAAGCILALEHRRWLLGGILAGFATAVQPVALALIPVCVVSAMLEFRRCRWSYRAARRSLLAPLLSLTGVCAFASFLWAWTGTPFATLQAQHYGWGERTSPFALVHQALTLASEISFTHFNHPTINLNLVIGSLGVVVMVIGLWLLLRRPRLVSIEAIVWTLGIGFLASTSEYVPPNPRVLITAFPIVIVFAHYLKGRRYAALAIAGGGLLVVLSALTFVGTTLRP
jgi:Mannosyltransferase (PIG-V)